jgi:SIR2-like protein
LGAGASAPLGKPLMVEFINRLADTLKKDELEFLKQLRNFRGDDLESILGELDTLIGLDYASAISGSWKGAEFTLWRGMATQLLATIKHTIIKEYRNVDETETMHLYDPLFDVLLHRSVRGKQPIVIFTTNYDPAIEVYCQQRHNEYNLVDGFAYDVADRHNWWDRSVFDNYEMSRDGKTDIVLFKLHGSVDWLWVKAKQKIRRGQAMYTAMDADAYGNVLIYPATRKIATEDPYYSAYEYYQRCCENTQKCVAIGYSFRDYDALTRLRGAIGVNSNLELIILSPDATELATRIPIPASRKKYVDGRFGDLIAVTDLELALSR